MVLLLALFVRFVDPDATRSPRHLVASAADLRLVRRYQRVFYVLVVLAPCEWWWRGRPAGWTQLAGAALMLAGVVGYRRAGGTLGEQLSPLVAPNDPPVLVAHGPYRRLRHPMYLAELALAFGAPLLLGARLTLLLAVLFASLVLHRIGVEERVLGERLPGYDAYAARTYRLLPYVY